MNAAERLQYIRNQQYKAKRKLEAWRIKEQRFLTRLPDTSLCFGPLEQVSRDRGMTILGLRITRHQIARALGVFGCLILTSCMTSRPSVSSPSAGPEQALQATFTELSPPGASRTAVAPEPKGERLSFAWDPSGDPAVTHHSLLASSNGVAGPWREVARGSSSASVQVFLPQWFTVVAVSDQIQSESSNTIGVLGRDTVVKVIGESSPDLSTWTEYGVVFLATNPPAPMNFIRNKITSTSTLKIEQHE
jgi:hypothetical protein